MPDRRDLISDMYHAALARAAEERAAFLFEACNGDEALREEVYIRAFPRDETVHPVSHETFLNRRALLPK